MDLENFGVREMGSTQVKETLGGGAPAPGPWWAWAALIVAAGDLLVGIHEGIHEGHKEHCK